MSCGFAGHGGMEECRRAEGASRRGAAGVHTPSRALPPPPPPPPARARSGGVRRGRAARSPSSTCRCFACHMSRRAGSGRALRRASVASDWFSSRSQTALGRSARVRLSSTTCSESIPHHSSHSEPASHWQTVVSRDLNLRTVLITPRVLEVVTRRGYQSLVLAVTTPCSTSGAALRPARRAARTLRLFILSRAERVHRPGQGEHDHSWQAQRDF